MEKIKKMKKVDLLDKPAVGTLAEFDADHVKTTKGMRAASQSRSRLIGIRFVRSRRGK